MGNPWQTKAKAAGAAALRHGNVAIFVPHAGCPHRCSFCDQRTIAGVRKPVTPSDVEAACREAETRMTLRGEQTELAFFGGSFTALPREEMCALLDAALPFVRRGVFAGIRLSTRPDCVDEAVLADLLPRGVTAVELGAQSMDDVVLARNGRGHTAADVERAAGWIRDAGLSLGLQMMTGLPGSSPDLDRETARRLADLQPDTVRIYPTIVLRGTPLADFVRAGTYTPPELEDTVALCAALLLFFEEERGIPVIRLGLHASPELDKGRVAGPWHPAFRELCESRIYRDRAAALLQEGRIPPGPVRLFVHPRALSKMIGQRRETVRWFQERGYAVNAAGDPALPLYQVRIGGDAASSKEV